MKTSEKNKDLFIKLIQLGYLNENGETNKQYKFSYENIDYIKDCESVNKIENLAIRILGKKGIKSMKEKADIFIDAVAKYLSLENSFRTGDILRHNYLVFLKQYLNDILENYKTELKRLFGKENAFEYDVFLAGPWEKYAGEPYKSRLKKNLKNLKFYDPELESNQNGSTWFEDNYNGIIKSRVLVSFESFFPGSSATRETGIFYGLNGDGKNALENMVIIFPNRIKPNFDIEFAKKIGIVVQNIDEAEEYLKKYFGIN